MLISFEKYSRIKDYFRYSKIELNSLAVLILVFGFIFSINHPGESFRIVNWLGYLFISIVVVAISFFTRISLQKLAGLEKGYYVEFKTWWEGVAASVLLSLFSLGNVPLIFAGGIISSFMVRHRLGEFQYGYSYEENSQIALSGFIGNLILATLFGLFLYFSPESFFASTGLKVNLIMAFCFLIPFPQLEGLQVYFGSRFLYSLAWITLILVSLLLLSKTKIGLILIILIGSISGIIRLLWK